MNIVYFGTDVFLNLFEYFRERHHILALYTYHNDEDYFTEYNIVREAAADGIPVFYQKITLPEISRYLDQNCRLFFMAEYGHIIPVPEDSRFRAVNVHSSFLPEGKGYYPIESALLRGKTHTGVTIHKAVKQTDSGEILARCPIAIEEQDDSIDIYLKSAAAADAAVREMMEDFEGRWQTALPQTGDASYWFRPEETLLWLRHDMTAAEAAKAYRCFNKMLRVKAGGKSWRVVSLTASRIKMAREELFISPQRLHYQLADGHARIQITEAEG